MEFDGSGAERDIIDRGDQRRRERSSSIIIVGAGISGGHRACLILDAESEVQC